MAYQLVCDQPYSNPGTGWACPGVESSIEVNPSFDVSTLDPAAVVSAVGSGLIVAGVPLILILCCRLVLFAIYPNLRQSK
jgi:hypothetical protein